MKVYSLIIIPIFCFLAQFSRPADKSVSPFLFEEFQDAMVLYKDGRRFAVPLNFNLATGQYVFIDPKDKLEKEFSQPDLIALLQINNRKFLATEGKATEIIQMEPLFYVVYTGKMKKAPQETTYGGISETASINSYTGISEKGVMNSTQANNRIVADVIKEYEVKVSNKIKRFYNKRSFLRIFAKNQRPNLEAYMNEHNTDFNSVEQVLALYQYAVSL